MDNNFKRELMIDNCNNPYHKRKIETKDFIKLAKNRLTNFGYDVYTNEKDKNSKNDIILEDNELLIAIKD